MSLDANSQSSEVFADMFFLPSGSATRCEGQDKDHPILFEGYKDGFTCLLKVMYSTYVHAHAMFMYVDLFLLVDF